jgi:hypothetical protein
VNGRSQVKLGAQLRLFYIRAAASNTSSIAEGHGDRMFEVNPKAPAATRVLGF